MSLTHTFCIILSKVYFEFLKGVELHHLSGTAIGFKML